MSLNKQKTHNTSLNHNSNKIELVSCPRNGVKCKNHLAAINEDYSESSIYHQNREYQKSIEALNNAFTKTFELKEDTCTKCANMFRSTIIQSLEDIHLELHSMSKGLFKTKRYQSSYILAGNVLNNLKSTNIKTN